MPAVSMDRLCTKERSIDMKQEEKILLNLADYLAKENLITPDEKARLKELIRYESR